MSASAAQGPAVAEAPVSERRTTSVLFGDLVGFTTLSESRDPEDVRELLSRYFAVARTVVGRYGGTIEKFIGDAVMAVWGVPVAHEDDAERAVRAGLDLVAEITALGADVGAADLQMRVGVVTGSVAVTLGATNEGMVAGDAVNTAARVQATAAPGAVWTDAETRGLTAAAVAYTDMGEHPLKGKAELVRLFRADAVVAAIGGAQRVDGLEAPLVGRDAEVRRIRETFHATEGDGQSRIVLLEGEAGTGKSRLGWEYEKYVDGLLDGVAWHRGRCLSYGEGVGFWAFAEMMRSRLGILDGDDRATVDTKIATGVARYAADLREAAWLEPRLAALVAGGSAGTDRTVLFSAWSTFLERVGGDRPVILLFEDVQHADDGLLELLEHLFDACRAPLYVLVLARPGLRDRRPSLFDRATTIGLGPLDDATMSTLVDGLVAELPDAARAALVHRAEGVPLYAVEIVRSLIDRDAVVARDGRYVFDDPDGTKVDVAQLAAPTSLRTLVAARLDALSRAERRTAQDAAVLGLSFTRTGLLAVSELSRPEVDAALEGLTRKGIVETETDPRSPEVGFYRFLQGIVREVAHGTIGRKDRRFRHLAAADHLEKEASSGTAPVEGVIAQHLMDALEATPVTDPSRTELAARARRQLVAAAERAKALGSFAEAVRCGLAALDLDPPATERGAIRVAVAANANDCNRYDLALDVGQAAQHEDDPRVRTAAVGQVALALASLGRAREAVDLVEPVFDALERAGDRSRELTGLCRTLTFAARTCGEQATGLRAALVGVRLAEQGSDAEDLVRALEGLSLALQSVAGRESALAVLNRAIEIAREEQLIGLLALPLGNRLADLYAYDLGAATEALAEALEVSRRAGAHRAIELALANGGFMRWLSGGWSAHLDDVDGWLATGGPRSYLQEGMELSAGLIRAERGLPLTVQPSISTEPSYERGLLEAVAATDPADAAAIARRAFDAFVAEGALDDFEVHWPVAVELQIRAGDVAAARAMLAPAALRPQRCPLLRAQSARLHGLVAVAEGGDPETDLRFAEAELVAYGAPFYVARTRLELGRWLHTQDRDEEAAVLLEQARRTFVDLGAARSLAEMPVHAS